VIEGCLNGPAADGEKDMVLEILHLNLYRKFFADVGTQSSAKSWCPMCGVTKVLRLFNSQPIQCSFCDAAMKKRIEYREQTPYWRKRLEGRHYDLIKFRNGCGPKAPEMLVQFRGVRRYGKGRKGYYAIRVPNAVVVPNTPCNERALVAGSDGCFSAQLSDFAGKYFGGHFSQP
jgi:hypothetical protein